MTRLTLVLAFAAALAGCGGASESHTTQDAGITTTVTTVRGIFGTTTCTTMVTYGGSVFHSCE